MYITSVRARGFADLDDFTAHDLGRVVTIAGPTPQTTALGDALQLAFAALSPLALLDLLERWDLGSAEEPPEVLGEPFPDQATWVDAGAARAIVGPDRTLQVEVDLHLDPPLYGELRQQAAREPRLVTALASGGQLRLGVGALFNRSLDAVALSIDRIAVGDVPISEADRVRWADRLLRRVAARLHRFRPGATGAAAALAALTSRDRLDAYEAWSHALLPDGPRLRVVTGPGGKTGILADERPLARWGRRVQEQAALAAAVHLERADILWAETDLDALGAAVIGASSPLEQVFVVRPNGELVVESVDRPARPTTPLPTQLRSTPTP